VTAQGDFGFFGFSARSTARPAAWPSVAQAEKVLKLLS
jgi:hypothetical protein